MEAVFCVRGVEQIYCGWSPDKGPRHCHNRIRISCSHFHTVWFKDVLYIATDADTTDAVTKHPSSSQQQSSERSLQSQLRWLHLDLLVLFPELSALPFSLRVWLVQNESHVNDRLCATKNDLIFTLLVLFMLTGIAPQHRDLFILQ